MVSYLKDKYHTIAEAAVTQTKNADCSQLMPHLDSYAGTTTTLPRPDQSSVNSNPKTEADEAEVSESTTLLSHSHSHSHSHPQFPNPSSTTDDLEASNSTITNAALSSSSSSNTMFVTLSSIYGASAVMLGAFGAHGLKKRIGDPGRVANWSTAAQYQVSFPWV